MSFQADPVEIVWRLHLSSVPAAVYTMLATDDGRARFWAESAVARNGVIHFVFPGGQTWSAKLLEQRPPHRFVVEYFGGSVTKFLGAPGIQVSPAIEVTREPGCSVTGALSPVIGRLSPVAGQFLREVRNALRLDVRICRRAD